MNNQLVPMTPQTWDMIKSVAPVVQAARMFKVTEEQAAVVMLKGHELGLGLASAFEYIHVIDDKPSLSPKGAMALIQRSGELKCLVIDDQVDGKGVPTACMVTMKRRNGFEYTCSYTMEDAKRANLVKAGSGWAKYPANMLRWRAIGYCADVAFPDVCGGMYRPEELGANVQADGSPVVDAVVVSVEEVPAPPATLTIWDLIDAGYVAKQITDANDDMIPITPDECRAVLAKLEAAYSSPIDDKVLQEALGAHLDGGEAS